MTRALAFLLLSACTAQATQQAPCVQPASERIELHSGESVTEAALEAFYGTELDGAPQ